MSQVLTEEKEIKVKQAPEDGYKRQAEEESDNREPKARKL